MNQIQYLKKFLASLPEMARQTDYSVVQLALSYGICYLFHGANSEEFRALRLYEYSNRRRSEFLLFRDAVRFSDALNADATKDDIDCFGSKLKFNECFKDFIHREWLYIPDSSQEKLRAFFAGNDQFLAKACSSTQGKNIFKYERGTFDPEAFLAQYQDKPFLLEAFIHQHPTLAALNPSSVNTVRIQTARKGDQVILLGGCLRCGGTDAYVDNFHQGGVAYPLDIETGIVSGPGRTLQGDDRFLRHPSTGHIMPGLRIPFWDELTRMLWEAALVVPHVGYVGWDVAITENGPELVEGNVNYPDPTLTQLDGRGLSRRLSDFVKAQ